MSDMTYDVVANLTVKGGSAFESEMGKVASKSAELGSSWDRMLSGGAAFKSNMTDIARFATGVAGIGVSVVTGAATMAAHAIGGSLSELEGKSIQLASVLAAATKTPFLVMEKETRGLFDQFRKDAVESAGETADFVNIASKIGGPIMGAGKSMEDLHRITKGVVEMAPSLGIKFEQAGSDVMRMLQGTAGMESPLFAAMVAIPSLGIKKAEEFNRLDPSKRIAKLEEALTNPAFRSAAEAYGKSWEGLTSTFQDVTKSAGMALGEPLYALAKKGLEKFNNGAMDFLSKKGGLLKLTNLGSAIASDFAALANVLKPIFPSFEGSAQSAMDFIEFLSRNAMNYLIQGTKYVVENWDAIKHGARAAYEWIDKMADRAVDIVTALGGGDLTKGLERMAKIGLVSKGAEAMAPGVTMAAGGASLLGSLGKMLGPWLAGGGAAAAGAAEAGTVAVAGAGTAAAGSAAATTAAAAAGGVTAAALGEVTLILAALAAAGMAVWQAFQNSSWLMRQWDFAMKEIDRSLADVSKSCAKLWETMKKLYEQIEPLIGLIGGGLAMVILSLVYVVDILILAFGGLVEALNWVLNGVNELIDGAKEKVRGKSAKLGPTEDNDPKFGNTDDVGDYTLRQLMATGGANATKAMTPKKKEAAKAAQKVEVVIKWEFGDGNEDAILIRARKDYVAAIQEASKTIRGGRLIGT